MCGSECACEYASLWAGSAQGAIAFRENGVRVLLSQVRNAFHASIQQDTWCYGMARELRMRPCLCM